MSRYMNYDSTSIPKGRSVGDKMPLFENEEVERLKERISELESVNADLYSALLSAEQSIVTFMGVHGYSNDSGAGYILAEVKTALAKTRGEGQPR